MTMKGVRTLSVRAKQRGRTLFFDNILCQTPENNTDSTLTVLFFGFESIDAVLELYVNVATKSENAIVALREIQANLVGLVFCRTNKGELTFSPKRYANSNVLVLGALRIERRRIICAETKRVRYYNSQRQNDETFLTSR